LAAGCCHHDSPAKSPRTRGCPPAPGRQLFPIGGRARDGNFFLDGVKKQFDAPKWGGKFFLDGVKKKNSTPETNPHLNLFDTYRKNQLGVRLEVEIICLTRVKKKFDAVKNEFDGHQKQCDAVKKNLTSPVLFPIMRACGFRTLNSRGRSESIPAYPLTRVLP